MPRIFDRGMKGGFFHAWLFGLGAVTADVLYMALIYFGVAQFLTAPFLKTFLWLFGFFVLTYTGIESLVKAKEVSLMRGAGVERVIPANLFCRGW